MDRNKQYAIPVGADPEMVIQHRRRLYVWVLVAVLVLVTLLFTLRFAADNENSATQTDLSDPSVNQVVPTTDTNQADVERLRQIIQTVPEPTVEDVDRLREIMQTASESTEITNNSQ